MSNYKVKVNNEAESREVQGLFFELGATLGNGDKHAVLVPNITGLAIVDGLVNFVFNAVVFTDIKQCKELTIPQLRDLVVLKRNDRDDRNVIQDGDNNCLYDLYLTSENELYFYDSRCSKWLLSALSGQNDYYLLLKPIKKKEMKEYLVPQDSGKYALTKATEKRVSDWVEVPEGANIYASANDGISTFWGDEYQWTRCGKITRKASEDKSFSFSDWQKTWSAEILWQRHTQPEELPFVDDEPKSLNDTYAEIEQVRQDNVNNPSHYSDSSIECIDAMEAMMTPEQFIGYLRGNVFKYQWRYEKKNGIEDLKKAQWYLDKLVTKVNEK